MSLFGLTETDGILVLPGPHAKWVTMEAGRITAITTYMSGEILNLLKKDSLVSRLIPATYEAARNPFAVASRRRLNKRPARPHPRPRLFSAQPGPVRPSGARRDRRLPGRPDDRRGNLRGAGQDKPKKINVVGHVALAEGYKMALEIFGAGANLVTPDIAAGFRRVASRQGDRSRAIEGAKAASGEM